MKTAVVRLKSASAYSQSRPHATPKLGSEGPDDYEKRTWREKCHAVEDGTLFIPGMGFKFALDDASKFVGKKIVGKGNATWTKRFLAGVLVLENPLIQARKDEVAEEWLFVNADGKRGSGKRVWRCFPLIPSWETELTFHVADDTITKDVFVEHLREAGKFVGIGRFAPRVGGFKGRFEVAKVSWQ